MVANLRFLFWSSTASTATFDKTPNTPMIVTAEMVPYWGYFTWSRDVADDSDYFTNIYATNTHRTSVFVTFLLLDQSVAYPFPALKLSIYSLHFFYRVVVIGYLQTYDTKDCLVIYNFY